jgi:uncharacterized protein (DUF305 family)
MLSCPLIAALAASSLSAQHTHSHGASSSGSTLSGVERARADSVRYPYTAADIEFMSGMIGHHAQAVTMSKLAPTRAASGAVMRLAERIINAQEDEMATMRRWLRDRNQPVPDSGGMDHSMHAMPGMSHAMMPGMLSPEQMSELTAARGIEFDRLYLRYMIQHHKGATAMVKKLFATEGAGQDLTIFKFAADVNVDQTTEIARMQRMLVDLEFQRASAP